MLKKIYNHFVEPKIQLVAATAAASERGYSTFQVAGNNMAPTLKQGDVAWFLPYQSNRKLERGEIFAMTIADWRNVVIPYRVLGLPGDSIELRGGDLIINGNKVAEPYLEPGRTEQDYSLNAPCIDIPQDHIWILGDFRDMSKDSRNFGPVPISCIVGQVQYAHSLGAHKRPRSVQ